MGPDDNGSLPESGKLFRRTDYTDSLLFQITHNDLIVDNRSVSVDRRNTGFGQLQDRFDSTPHPEAEARALCLVQRTAAIR